MLSDRKAGKAWTHLLAVYCRKMAACGHTSMMSSDKIMCTISGWKVREARIHLLGYTGCIPDQTVNVKL